MKNSFGKIGLGLATAVACAALISAAGQTAQAQIVLTSASPVGTNGTVAGTYNFTYYLTFGAPGTTLLGSGTNQAFVSLALDGFASDVYSTPTLTLTNSGILGSFGSSGNTTTDGGTYAWNYTGSTYTSLGTEAIGYITVVTGTDNALTPLALNYTTQAATNVTAASPAGQTDLTQKQVAVPDIGGTPLAGSSVPLPAALWPGLLTLTGMAVVGGLKYRRRTI